MELQGRFEELKQQGLAVAVITYDSTDVLKAFAGKRGITFPLLSDRGSAIIRQYGLLNEEYPPDNRAYGVPYPGTFLLDARGLVVARFFEQVYQERNTSASIAVQAGRPLIAPPNGTTIRGKHLDALAYPSDETVAIGERFTAVLDVTPARGIHVYAPPQTDYIAVSLTLNQLPEITLHPLKFPPSEIYEFKPLNEKVQVYMKPFRLAQEVTLKVTPATRELAKQPDAHLTLSGRLSYQACDDQICFAPEDLKVSWTVKVKGLEP